MASVKLTLDTRVRKQDGTYPVKLTISHHGQTSLHSLDVSLHRDEWDVRRCVVIGNTNKTFLNSYLLQRLTEWRNVALQMQSEGKFKNKTAREVRDMIRQHLSPDEQKPVTFGTWYAHFTHTHENARTRAIYNATWVQVCRYDLSASERKFEDINKAWLDGFFRWCAKTSPSINARNIHLRNIRAVFNDAIDNDITTAYPFRRMKITPVATPKRNLTVEVLREIFMADVEPWRKRYYDAFRLSFLLIGMNIVDLCNLTPEQYLAGRIQYNRRKTHRLYDIKVEREARDIIERNRGNKLLLSWSEGRTSYRQFAAKVNKFLPDNITTYYARHSWATIAASLDIPDDVISQALGHAARNSTTAIYIERSQRKVDEANRRVIDFVLKG